MIITKKEFKEITDKVIAETKKEAAEKINGFNLDIRHPEETKQVQKTVNKMFQLYYKGIALELFEDSEDVYKRQIQKCLIIIRRDSVILWLMSIRIQIRFSFS